VPKINSFKFSVKILELDTNPEFASCHKASISKY
jgi:hypothetical protein